MAEIALSRLPRLTAEQRHAAATQFERAKQVLTAGDYDYGLQLLLNCCLLDTASPIYRQALHQAQRARFNNKPRNQKLAWLLTLRLRWKLMKAQRNEDYRNALHYAEQILIRDPWDLSTHRRMAEIFEELGLYDLAIWTFEQLRPTRPVDPKVTRPLARLYESRGNFTQAIALWQLVRKACPEDVEASHKAKDLAASATIARGRYDQAVQGHVPTPLMPIKSPNAASEPTEAAQAILETKLELPKLDDRAPREVQALQVKIQSNPTNANTYLQLARYYRRMDQFEQAHAVLSQGLVPTGNSFDISQEILDLEIEPFRRDLAVTEEKLRQNPTQADLPEIRSRLSQEINTRELEMYRRRSDRYPTDVAARYETGIRLMHIGQIDEAIRELQAIRSEPRFHGKALFYLGFCFKTRNNWRLAQRNFEEALPQLANDDQMLRREALYQLAVGHAESGDWKRAVDLGCELANIDFAYKNIGKLVDDWQTRAAK